LFDNLIGDLNQELAELKDKRRKEGIHALKQIFLAIDTSGDGNITLEEFNLAMHEKEIVDSFREMQIPASEMGWLFEVLDKNDDRSVNVNEFINGCLHLYGLAEAKDLFQIHLAVFGLSTKVKKFQDKTFPEFARRLMEHLDGELELDQRRLSGKDVATSQNPKLNSAPSARTPAEDPLRHSLQPVPEALRDQLLNLEREIDIRLDRLGGKVSSLISVASAATTTSDLGVCTPVLPTGPPNPGGSSSQTFGGSVAVSAFSFVVSSSAFVSLLDENGQNSPAADSFMPSLASTTANTFLSSEGCGFISASSNVLARLAAVRSFKGSRGSVGSWRCCLTSLCWI